MARKRRVEYPSAVYHVMNRGGRREIDVPQSTTTQLQDVGRTKFDLPKVARKKRGA